MLIASILCDGLIGDQIFMPGDAAPAPWAPITSNFFDRGLVPFAMTLLQGAAVEVRRCYCVVTKSEFAVPLSEQLQTPGFHTDLGGPSHLVFAGSGIELGGNNMSFVTTQPEALAAAAGNLQAIGSTLSAQNAAAAAPTTGVVPAAADEVSALTAAQFAAHAQMYQAVSAQAAAIHEMFVNTLSTSSGSYAATEAANAAAAL